MKFFDRKWKRWVFWSSLSAAVLVGGYFTARRVVWPAVKTWRVERMNADAREFLDKKDYPNALLTARKALRSSTISIEGWRIAVQAAEAQNSGEALYYQQNLLRLEPTKKNYLDMIRLSLKLNAPGYATQAMKNASQELSDQVREDPEFHRLAARVFTLIGQQTTARFHLISLTQLAPTDQDAQLELAALELAADPERKDEAIRARIMALSLQPGLRARALSILLNENVTQGRSEGTADLVRRLQQETNLEVVDRLRIVRGLYLLKDPQAPAMLAKIQAEVAADPANVALVMNALAATGQLEPMQRWYATLSQEVRKDENVQRELAEGLMRMEKWSALELQLRGAVWPQREYLRQAMLARAYRAQGRSADFAEAWRSAINTAGSNLSTTVGLLGRVEEWKWTNERFELAWKLYGFLPDNAQIKNSLISWERSQGNTANLNRLFARMIELDPKDDVAKNNFAYTSLLLDSNVARAIGMARDLSAANPKNPYFTTTYAFALYKQGSAADALEKIKTLDYAQSLTPERLLMQALFLTGVGDARGASDRLRDVTLPPLLPEEKRLADTIETAIARLDRSAGNRSRVLAIQKGGEGTVGTGWLALVDQGLRATASTDMILSDSVYASASWAELQDVLRKSDWRDNNYLRFALLAYAARQRDDTSGSQSAWRQAVTNANRENDRVRNLRAMASGWNWPAERMEATNLVFERNPTDRVLLEELINHYRETRRTFDLVRVLGLYLDNTPGLSDEAVEHAYYSLLVDNNVSQAHVTARNAYEAARTNSFRKLVYAFSLWKQQRIDESAALLKDFIPEVGESIVPAALVRAAILADQTRNAEAAAALANFDAATALPEEAAIARRVTTKLEAATAATGSSTTP